MRAALALTLALLARTVLAARVETWADVASEELGAAAFKDVDFGFMTRDRGYPSRDTSIMGKMGELLVRGRAESEVKEEIVAGHACAKRGARDQTYFASSFCYWLPELEPQQQLQPQGPGLKWLGGAYPDGRELGAALAGGGKCLRSTVCHNNARNEERRVDADAAVEELPLPAGCLGEKEVERRCVEAYDGDSGGLAWEAKRCRELRGRVEEVERQLSECENKLQTLPGEIQEALPQKISSAEGELARARSALENERLQATVLRAKAVGACAGYVDPKGIEVMNKLSSNTPIEQIPPMVIFCHYPLQPIRIGNSRNNIADSLEYAMLERTYEACERCKAKVMPLSTAVSTVRISEAFVNEVEGALGTHRGELDAAREALERARTEHTGLASSKASLDAEWGPQSSRCSSTEQQYRDGRAQAVVQCAPRFYEHSCERACLELQAQRGCGVAEGSRPGDPSGAGGIEVECAPPQPSWIFAPNGYGQPEALDGQCRRILATQSAQYAQQTLKAGLLWKAGRTGGWEKRYFLLESGDMVRSAVLRYWADGREQWKKGLILHDATSVEAKSGSYYRFRNGEECFQLSHFYRSFSFCVPTGEGAAAAAPATERDEWVSLLAGVVGK